MSRLWIRMLVALALTQSGLSYLMWRSSWNHEVEARTLGLKAAEVQSLVIEDQGKKLVLERRGAVWVLPEAFGYPARAQKVQELLSKLESMDLGNPVARERSSHKRLKVADDLFERKLIWDKSPGLILGTSPSYNVLHVRPEGQDRVFQADGLSVWDLEVRVRDWVNPEILSIPAADCKGYKLVSGETSFEATKGEAGDWIPVSPSPNGEPFDPQAFSAYVNSHGYLSLESVLVHVSADSSVDFSAELKARGLDPAVIEITFTLETTRKAPLSEEERKVHTVRLGDEKDGLVPVVVDGGKTIFGVKREALAKVLDFNYEDIFRKPAPKPETK